MVDSREIEELTLNAWPPRQSLYYDGWLLTFNDGYTRRANSVHPLYPARLQLDEKLAYCESAYAAQGRAVTYKITSSPCDADLDGFLEQRGYARIAPTSVQTADLAHLPPLVPDQPVLLETVLTDTWFVAFNRLTLTPPSLQPTERLLLERITPPHAFALITLDSEAVAVGLAVAERGYVGLFDIVVDSGVRNQGLGRSLCTHLLHWARANCAATTAYLAVMLGNEPALKLYANLAFREAYTYWYCTQAQ